MSPTLLPGELPLSETTIGTVDSFSEAQEMMTWLSESRGRNVLAVDTETTGLDPYARNAHVRLFQVGDANEAWVINAERYPGLCQEVLETYRDTPFVFHNVSFDAGFMSVVWPEMNFPWSRTHDTMLMHRLHDNEAPAGLKPVSEKYFGRTATSGQKALETTMENGKWDWATVPMSAPAYRIYSGVDVLLTARLYRRMEHIHSGEFKRPYELEMQTRRICTNMELRGMQIDVPYCLEKKAELDKYVEGMTAWCEKEYGFSITSTAQLGKHFISEGAPLVDFTATGAPKMDETTLEMLAGKGYDIAAKALKIRKANKISSTYLSNFIKFGETSNGIVHPQINTMAARTGRMSITNPALQTLPRTDVTVRPSVIPHEGQVLLSSDLDQVEFRFISALAGDTALIDRFIQADLTGPDIFTQIGQEVFSDPDMVKKDPRRDTIKTYIYSSLYGAGIEKQALSAGISYGAMKKIADDFSVTYPQLAEFKQKVGSELETMARSGARPYVTTYTGRRLYVDPKRTYAGVNYLIQSSCAEIMKYNLIDLDFAGLGEYLLCPVHDEIVMSVPPEDVHEIRETVAECMTTTEFAVPLPADCSEPMLRWKK